MASPLPAPSYLSSEQDYALLAQREALFAPHARLAFEVLEKLGEGGMGAVYKVRDKRLSRLAALKVLANEKADQNAQTRFLREARVTARLDHPSIPPVHEAGRTAGGELYLLMRLIQGQTLGQKISDLHDQGCSQSGLTELLQALVKVAEAIAYAHSQGVIHRDLKPDNIMIGAFGEVLVLDWGIASVSGIKDQGEGLDLADSNLAEISGLTQAGSFLGTPGYAAPEQIDGDPIDGRADVFALGLLLTEVLTGQAAISGDTGMDLARATASGSISRPRDFLPSLPRDLDWIADRATAVDREDRTSTAREFTNQLQSYLTGAPIPGYPYNLYEKIIRNVRSHPLLLLGLLMGALTLSLAILLQNALRESKRRQDELTASRIKEEAARAEAEAAQIAEAKAKAEVEKSKRISELFNEAQGLARRGMNPEKIKELIDDALQRGHRDYHSLLIAAQIFALCGSKNAQKSLLTECVDKSDKAYEALFELHLIELGEQPASFSLTKPLRMLIDRASAAGDENEYTLLALAHRLQSSGDTRAALEACDKAEGYSTKLAFLYNNRGLLKEKLRDDNGAGSDYDRAIQCDPRLAAAYCNRGSLRKKLGDKQGAGADFDKAIDCDPRRSVAYNNRGLLRFEQGDTQGAISDYEKAIEFNPDYSLAYTNRGALRMSQRDLKGALSDFNRALECDPRSAIAFTHRGVLLSDSGDKVRAKADFDQAIKADPEYTSAYYNRGVLHADIGDTAKALSDYDKAIELDENNIHSYLNRGGIHYKNGDRLPALNDYRKFLKLAPRHSLAPKIRARISELEKPQSQNH